MASSVVQALLRQRIPQTMLADVLSEFDSTGDISDDTLKKAGIYKKSSVQFLRDQLKEFAPKTSLSGLSQSQLKRIGGIEQADVVDEAGLSDEALGTRTELFKELGKAGPEVDYGTIERAVESKLRANGANEDITQSLKQTLAKAIMREGKIDPANLRHEVYNFITQPKSPLGNILNVAGGIDPVWSFIDNPNTRDSFSSIFQSFNTGDTNEDVKRIEDILSGRKESAQRETDITNFIEEIPQELSTSRDARIAELREMGGRRFESMAPQILGRENALGRFNSGAAEDALSSGYGDITANIDAEAANLQAGDDQFYFDAAYQNQIRKLMEGRTDLATSMATEKQNIRTGQEQRFQNTQFDLNANMENDLLMQKYENQIQAAQALRKRQQELASNASGAARNGAMGGIGGTLLGAGIGAALAVPTGGLSIGAGAALGAGVGGGVGTGLPLLFSKR